MQIVFIIRKIGGDALIVESRWQGRLRSGEIGQHQDSVVRAVIRRRISERTFRSVLTGVTYQQIYPLQLLRNRCSLINECKSAGNPLGRQWR